MRKMDIFIEEGNNVENLEPKTKDNGTNEGQSVVEHTDNFNIMDADLDEITSLPDPTVVKTENGEVNWQTMQDNLPAQNSMDALPLKDKPNFVTHIIDPPPESNITGSSQTTASKSPEKNIADAYPSDGPGVVITESRRKHVSKTENLVECNEGKSNSSSSVAEPVPGPSRKHRAKLEIDYVSNDPKENQDNFDAGWEAMRSLSRDRYNYSLVRKRWGNMNHPDPSVDLTYRHRNRLRSASNRQRGRKRRKSDWEPIKSRSLSCVSHLERLMDNARRNYYSEYKKLSKRHDWQLLELYNYHQTEFARLAQMPLRNFDELISGVNYVLHRQRQVSRGFFSIALRRCFIY